MFGFRPEDYSDQEVEVWPENWPAFSLFQYLQTQWRVSMGGPTGLDYNVMHHKLDRMNPPPDEYDQLEDDIRVMEIVALGEMNKKD